jgi:lysophospholipase L1-like esterase
MNGKIKCIAVVMLSILMLVTIFAISNTTSVSASSYVDTIGNTNYSGDWTVNCPRFNPITASASGNLTTVGINVLTASGNVIVSIYSTYNSSSKKCSGLLGQSASTPVTTGWNDLPVGAGNISMVQGVTYYLGDEFSSTSAYNYLNYAGTQYYYGMFYGAFPDPTGTLTSAGATDNMRIIYGNASPNPTPTSTPTPTPTPTPNPTQRILCLGDSITYGAMKNADGTWGQLPTPYPTTLQSLTGIPTTNAGVGGEQTNGMLSQWNTIYKSQGYTILVLLGGVNDIFDGTSIATAETNLQTIWQSALGYGCSVYAVEILPWAGISTNIITINNWIDATAPSLGVHVVYTYSIFNDPNNPGALNPAYAGIDGGHPNQAGANLLANTIYAAMNLTPTPPPTPTPSPSPSPTPTPTSLYINITLQPFNMTMQIQLQPNSSYTMPSQISWMNRTWTFQSWVDNYAGLTRVFNSDGNYTVIYD